MTGSDMARRRRSLFTGQVDAYQSGRPGYPDRVYDLLGDRCGLRSGTRVLEIGPGTGQVTGQLLDLGASVTAIELGEEMAARLRDNYPEADLTVRVGAFEDVEVEPSSADLVVAATAFHWVPTSNGLHRCADALADRGWLALWWNIFGDAARPDPFHDALTPILADLAPELLEVPGAGVIGTGHHPYALDVDARIGEIAATHRFGPVQHEVIAWTGRHDAERLRNLFGSFSPWLALPSPRRATVLDAVARLAVEQFGGLVERPYLTPVYLAPRLA